MRPLGLALALAASALLPSPAAEKTFELRGEVIPPVHDVVVTLSAMEEPFRKQGRVFYGKFKFKGLRAGSYTLVVYHPQWGELRKTVAIGQSLADRKGRIEVVVPVKKFPEARERAAEQRATVSVRELTVSEEARKKFRQARERLGKRKVKEAIRLLESAVELSPQFIGAWNELGVVAYQSARYAEAENYFRTALEHDPEAFSPLVNLGGALLSMKRFEESLEINRDAARMRSDSALAHAQLGMSYFYLERFDEAEPALRKALRLDPAHFSRPQIFLAEIYSMEGKLKQAREQLEHLLKHHPDMDGAADIREAIAKLEAQIAGR